jgi:hypothetical protein
MEPELTVLDRAIQLGDDRPGPVICFQRPALYLGFLLLLAGFAVSISDRNIYLVMDHCLITFGDSTRCGYSEETVPKKSPSSVMFFLDLRSGICGLTAPSF